MNEARFIVVLEGSEGSVRACADCAGQLVKEPGVSLWSTKRGGACGICRERQKASLRVVK